MEKRVSVRVLNQQTSAVLAAVVAGQTVTVTTKGKPIARIVPIVQEPEWVLKGIEEGWIIPATEYGPFPKPPHTPNSHINIAEMIARDRDED